MVKKSSLALILPLGILVIGCSVRNQIQYRLKGNPIESEGSSKISKIIESTEISIACNKETIQDYLDEGWKVISSSIEEVPCSWKTIKARRGCNLEKDKGCKITVPDMIGEKTTYILEKESIIENAVNNQPKSGQTIQDGIKE